MIRSARLQMLLARLLLLVERSSTTCLSFNIRNFVRRYRLTRVACKSLVDRAKQIDELRTVHKEYDRHRLILIDIPDAVDSRPGDEDDVPGADRLLLVAQSCRAATGNHVEKLIALLVQVKPGRAPSRERLLDQNCAC